MTLPSAHGGRLKPLLLPETPAGLERLPVLKLTPRQQCDVEMLLSGAFSPLTGFLGRDDYLAVLQTQRLADGTLWPVPIVLDVDRATLDAVGRAGSVLLLDAELNAVAVSGPAKHGGPTAAARRSYCSERMTHGTRARARCSTTRPRII
jgi:sulfate adenylyltransferase